MFITAKGTAPFLHPSRARRQQYHWPVITRALEAPWYLLIYDVMGHRGQKVSQTSLVACDEALVDMLVEMAAADIRGIGRLDRCHGPGPCWGLQWIDALWKPAPEEARKVGRLLIRCEADPVVRDALLRPVGEVAGRLLLYGRAACGGIA